MANIVLFGKTQVGKTTLAGYLLSYQMPDHEYQKSISRFQKMAVNMNHSENRKINTLSQETLLTCFVSMDPDEVLRNPRIDSIGTTKRVHRKRIRISESEIEPFILLDTPGTHRRAYEKYRGMFEADYGVFVASATDIEKGIMIEDPEEKELYFRDYYESLLFWGAYKEIKNSIIVLTKTDLCHNSINDKIIPTINNFTRMHTEEETLIIPVAVFFKPNEERPTGWNVDDSSGPWAGPSFINAIENMIKRENKIIESNKEDNASFAAIERISQINGTSKYAISCKVIEGSIKKGDDVLIGPVRGSNKEDPTIYIRGTVQSTKCEIEASRTDTLDEGDIGGITLRHAAFQEKKKKHRTIDGYAFCKSSAIIGKETKVQKGDTVKIRVLMDEMSKDELTWTNRVLPYEQVSFFWFDKMIQMNVIEKDMTTDSLLLSISLVEEGVFQCVREFVSLQEPFGDNLVIGIWLTEEVKENGEYIKRRHIRYLSAEFVQLYYWSDLMNNQYRLKGEDIYLGILKDNQAQFESKNDHAILRIAHKTKDVFIQSLRDARRYMRDNGVELSSFTFSR